MAAELGAQAITWHGYDKNLDDDRMFDRFAETARYLGSRARQVGVTVTIENVSWCCYVRRADHIYQIRDANLPLGFTFDPFQAMEAEQTPTEIIRAMGDRLTTVHLSDFGLGPVRHMALGEGIIDWRSIFRALDEVNYQGPLIMEAPYRGNLDVVASGRRFVEQQLGNFQRSEG
ncbi:MAG TPA: sugar phosphate isomerase/epimerase family protein [Aggregatilineaceae bacterium]|nr:sugar phosphate isomerase/epimerase family protein [Aggregatilineaceae bacterium]